MEQVESERRDRLWMVAFLILAAAVLLLGLAVVFLGLRVLASLG